MWEENVINTHKLIEIKSNNRDILAVHGYKIAAKVLETRHLLYDMVLT